MSSATRRLMADLRRRLGQDQPLAAPSLPVLVAEPPPRVFPVASEASRYAKSAAEHTTALLGIGHVGTRYATKVALQFQAELAVAHEAVAAELAEDWAEKNGLLALRSRASNHREFLLRPDLGRRLDAQSLASVHERARKDVDVQIILADGLSAIACMGSGMALLDELEKACAALDMQTGSRICAKFARVWLEDEIGQEVRAKVAIIVLGERPGLGTGDGLSAYLVYQPRMGKTDGDRNMMSNIHARGISPAHAAQRLALLARAMLDQECSGVQLDLAELSDFQSGYRAAQGRQRLVEVSK